MTGITPIAEWTDPNWTVQTTGNAYKNALDNAIMAGKRITDAFAPRAAGTPNMTVSIDPGFTVSTMGVLTEFALQTTGTITAPVSNPRIDRVVTVDGTLLVLTGAEAASPVAPALTNYTQDPVCQILLQTSSAAITDSMITDERSGNTHSTPNLKNAFINPMMSIDQVNEGASVAVATSFAGYVVDGWQVSFTGASTGNTAQRTASTSAILGPNYLAFTVGTGSATLNAGDFLIMWQNIEGSRIAEWLMGMAGASALPMSFSFAFRTSVAGTYSVALQNSAQNRSYVTTFTILSSQVNVNQIITLNNIPGDTTGTWLNGDGVIGMRFFVTLAAGSTYQTGTLNAWQAGNFLATNSSPINLGATSGATVRLAKAKASQETACSLIKIPTKAEALAECLRYYEKTFKAGTKPAQAVGWAGSLSYITPNSTSSGRAWGFAVTKCKAPTVVTYSPLNATPHWVDAAGSADVSELVDPNSSASTGEVFLEVAANPGNGHFLGIHVTADARL